MWRESAFLVAGLKEASCVLAVFQVPKLPFRPSGLHFLFAPQLQAQTVCVASTIITDVKVSNAIVTTAGCVTAAVSVVRFVTLHYSSLRGVDEAVDEAAILAPSPTEFRSAWAEKHACCVRKRTGECSLPAEIVSLQCGRSDAARTSGPCRASSPAMCSIGSSTHILVQFCCGRRMLPCHGLFKPCAAADSVGQALHDVVEWPLLESAAEPGTTIL